MQAIASYLNMHNLPTVSQLHKQMHKKFVYMTVTNAYVAMHHYVSTLSDNLNMLHMYIAKYTAIQR